MQRSAAAQEVAMTGLYDDQGMLRCAGRDAADCLAYADLFGLSVDRFSLVALDSSRPLGVHGPGPGAHQPRAWGEG